MDIRYYFSIFFRRIKEIMIISVIFSFITIIFSVFLVPKSFTSTVVATIASKRPENIDYRDYTVYETLRGADTLSETVQGWTKSPGFYNKLEQESGMTGFSVSVRTQEKQNLLIDIKADSKESVEEISDAFLKVLSDELEFFNDKSNSSFVIAWSSQSITEDLKDIKFLILVSFAVGLILATLFFYLYEFFAGICSFINQPEKVLKVKVLDSMKKCFKNNDLNYLKAYLKNLNKEYVLCGIGFKIKGFGKRIEETLNKNYISDVLSNSEILGKSNINLIVFVKLGCTKIEDLKKLKAVYKGDISLLAVK